MKIWDFIFPEGKEIIIWGAGKNGLMWFNTLVSMDKKIKCFFDKNAKQKEVKNGIQCLKPIEQKKFQGKYIVLISPISNVNEIYLQAKQYGFEEIIIGNMIKFIPNDKNILMDNMFSGFGHFYSLYPDLINLQTQYQTVQKYAVSNNQADGIDLNKEKQTQLLYEMNKMFDSRIKWADINDLAESNYRYRIHNQAYPINDALVLHFLLRILKPKNLIEVGSGYSSAVTLDTCENFLENINLTFIEPYPTTFFSLLKEKEKNSIMMIEKNLQDVQLDVFRKLEDGDVLFIDSTHVSKFGSDVNYLFFNILPVLKSGVIVHLHDIFYPWEYSLDWIKKGMGWNELYLLRSFLQYNNKWKILFFSSFMEKECFEMYNDDWKKIDGFFSGSFWMQKQ